MVKKQTQVLLPTL